MTDQHVITDILGNSSMPTLIAISPWFCYFAEAKFIKNVVENIYEKKENVILLKIILRNLYKHFSS
jgi:hypothetical protein